MEEDSNSHEGGIEYSDKYSDIIVSALAKEVVTYLGKKISIQKRIPTAPIIAALVIQVIVFIYSVYTALPNIIISQFHIVLLKILISISSTLVIVIVLYLLTTWNNRITLSKIAYLSLLDIVRYSKNRDELFEKNIEDYVGSINTTQLVIGLIIYIFITISWIVLSNKTPLTIALAIINNVVIGGFSYTTYILLRKESRYSQGIVNTVLKMLGGKKLYGVNPYINLRTMALMLVSTLGLASYYMLYRIIDMYNRLNEVSNEVETSLSINLLKLI